ncbi:MAG: hypothetical protein AB2693_32595 [Candidatus Thiodiazotropha sp.]
MADISLRLHKQGRRRRSGERRTTFLVEYAFGRTTFLFQPIFLSCSPVILLNRIIKSAANY